MAHGLTDVAAYAPSVVVPDPGDARNAASVEVPFQQLANRSAYFKRQVPGATNGSIMVPLAAGQPDAFTGGVWSWEAGGVSLSTWVQTDISGATPIGFELFLPDQITVTAVRAFVVGSITGVAHASLPATKPTLKLLEIDPGAGTVTFNASQTDTSGTIGAYDAQHVILLTTSRFIASQFRRYEIRFTGEGGAGAQAAKLALIGLQLDYTAAP
jgi:hypothetical protein